MHNARGLRTAGRGSGEAIAADTDIYLADTLGELGLFFRLAGIALIGGSLVAKGGHNPFEAARLDCAVLHGPAMANCAGMVDALAGAGAAETVRDPGGLAQAVGRLLADPRLRAARAAAAARVAAAGGGTLDAVLDRLAPWLDALAPLVAAEPPPPERPQVPPGHADAPSRFPARTPPPRRRPAPGRPARLGNRPAGT